MSADNENEVPWKLLLISAGAGVVGGFVGALAIPEEVFAFRTAIVGAVCVGITGGLLSRSGLRETVISVALAEAIRSLTLLVISGLWVLFYGGQGSGFVVFYLLVGGGIALGVAIISVPLAAIVGGLTVTARSSLQE
jgi:hypothetical protein